MKIQYYKHSDKIYVVGESLARVGDLGIMIRDNKADIFKITNDIHKYNNKINIAKELILEDLTLNHYYEQTYDERFALRKDNLLKIGFKQYNSVDFHLKDIWFCYWEQVFYKEEDEWFEYMNAIEEAHNTHFTDNIKWM